MVEKSSLSDEVKQDTRLAGRYNDARIALAKGDIAEGEDGGAGVRGGRRARKNTFRVRQAHELMGSIAMAEKQYDAALAHLAQANQQDPQVIYWTALAHQAKGNARPREGARGEGGQRERAAAGELRVRAGEGEEAVLIDGSNRVIPSAAKGT